MSKKLIPLIFICLLTQISFAQKQGLERIDSLRNLLNNAPNDTSKINIYNKLAWEIREEFPDSTGIYCNKSLLMIEKLTSKHNNQYMKEWLELATSEVYNNFGVLNNVVYNNRKAALEYHLKALAIRERLLHSKNKYIVWKSKYGLGDTYKNIGAANDDRKKIIYYSLKALTYLKETNNKRGEALVYSNLGVCYNEDGNDKKALEYYNRTLNIGKEINSPRTISIGYNLIANYYGEKGDKAKTETERNKYFQIAITYYIEGANAARKGKSTVMEIRNNNVIAAIYREQKKFNEALKYLNMNVSMAKRMNSKMSEADAYFGLAQMYEAKNDYKNAFNFLQLYYSINDSATSSMLSSQLNDVQSKYETEKREREKELQSEIKNAKNEAESKKQKLIILFVACGLLVVIVFAAFVFRSLRIRKKQNKIIESQKREVETSYKNLELLNTISNEITSSLNLNSVMNLIYKNVSSLMDVSFFIISTYDSAEESVDVKFCVKKGEIVPLSFKTYLSDPKSVMTALTVRNKKEIIINDWEKEYALYQTDVSQIKDKNDLYCDAMIWIPLLIKDKVIGLFSVQSTKKNAYSKYDIEMLRSLSSIIAVALNNADSYNKLDTANVEISNQKKLVETKNKEITDSIEYALRIQTAILPSQKIVKQYLKDSFILYKPKDIVAGDFYWMEALPNLHEGEVLHSLGSPPSRELEGAVLFAACDCTGHGVPGAMVSVVCHNALNRAVREFGLTKPSDILDKTQEIVLENFSKSEEDIKDGMDISLVALNLAGLVSMQWAGANNPLWIVRPSLRGTKQSANLGEIAGQARNDYFELIETKADKQPIGMNEDSKPFTNHIFELNSGDTIYIFSDGFADQFSPADKKLMKKNFKKILLSIQNKSMEAQHDFLKNYIENWKGSMEQTDDILVIGVRI